MPAGHKSEIWNWAFFNRFLDQTEIFEGPWVWKGYNWPTLKKRRKRLIGTFVRKRPVGVNLLGSIARARDFFYWRFPTSRTNQSAFFLMWTMFSQTFSSIFAIKFNVVFDVCVPLSRMNAKIVGNIVDRPNRSQE